MVDDGSGGEPTGRERLIRYCARTAIVLERLEQLPDGRYSYLTKYGRGDRTHRVMTGPELMARRSEATSTSILVSSLALAWSGLLVVRR